VKRRLFSTGAAVLALFALAGACRKAADDLEPAGRALAVTPARAAEEAPADPSLPRPNRSVGVGELVPDFTLTDQTGKPVRLSQFRGEPVGVTFLYTTCPDVTACPMTTAKFSSLAVLLKGKNFGHLLVVTVDPVHDTPEVLKEYAAKSGADPKQWSFLTGDPAAVAEVASRFGILYTRRGNQVLHQQGVAVVGPEGKLESIYYGETWQPEHVLRDMEKARKG
jgi:protein SCO1/2